MSKTSLDQLINNSYTNKDIRKQLIKELNIKCPNYENKKHGDKKISFIKGDGLCCTYCCLTFRATINEEYKLSLDFYKVLPIGYYIQGGRVFDPSLYNNITNKIELYKSYVNALKLENKYKNFIKALPINIVNNDIEIIKKLDNILEKLWFQLATRITNELQIS